MRTKHESIICDTCSEPIQEHPIEISMRWEQGRRDYDLCMNCAKLLKDYLESSIPRNIELKS